MGFEENEGTVKMIKVKASIMKVRLKNYLLLNCSSDGMLKKVCAYILQALSL